MRFNAPKLISRKIWGADNFELSVFVNDMISWNRFYTMLLWLTSICLSTVNRWDSTYFHVIFAISKNVWSLNNTFWASSSSSFVHEIEDKFWLNSEWRLSLVLATFQHLFWPCSGNRGYDGQFCYTAQFVNFSLINRWFHVIFSLTKDWRNPESTVSHNFFTRQVFVSHPP